MGILDALAGPFESLFNKALGDDSAKRSAQRQYNKEKEFAQNAIQWRVEDANAAGIHPLYAMGNPGIQAGGSPGPGMPTGDGQNLSRAIDSMRNRKERQQELKNNAVDIALNRERTKAEIALLNQQSLSEQARRQNDQRTPPAPQAGTSRWSSVAGDAGVVDYQPNKPINSSRSEPSREPGAITGTAFEKRNGGIMAVVPSQDIKNRIEDTPMDLEWMWNNKVVPMVGTKGPTSAPSTKEFPLKAGWSWRWVPALQAYAPYHSAKQVYQYNGTNYHAGSAFGWPKRKGNN